MRGECTSRRKKEEREEEEREKEEKEEEEEEEERDVQYNKQNLTQGVRKNFVLSMGLLLVCCCLALFSLLDFDMFVMFLIYLPMYLASSLFRKNKGGKK